VFQGKPFTTVFWPIAGVAVCILLRATLEYIRENSGTHFDPALLDIFLEYIKLHLADQHSAG
jgi:hypothetical protein